MTQQASICLSKLLKQNKGKYDTKKFKEKLFSTLLNIEAQTNYAFYLEYYTDQLFRCVLIANDHNVWELSSTHQYSTQIKKLEELGL